MSAPDRLALDRLAHLRHQPLARALTEAAKPDRAWLVGGAVRDALLGRPVADLDAVVESRMEEIAARLEEILPATLVRVGGQRFSALRLVARTGTLDLWNLAGGTLASDLERRDFTLNAMALDLADGALVDPFGGFADLAGGILRATRASVFADDALRVLRLARFVATLAGFSVEGQTAESARTGAAGLVDTAGERIRQELLRLWPAASYREAQKALAESGAWPLLWRDGDEGADDRSAAHAAVDRAAVLDELLGREAGPPSEPDSAGPDAADRIAAGHVLAAASASRSAAPAALARLARRAALSRHELGRAHLLLALAGEDPPATAGDLAWFLHRGRPAPRTAVALGGALADGSSRASWRSVAGRARELLGVRGDEILAPRPLLDGMEVAKWTGLAPGPALGAVVRRLLEAQVRGEVRDAEGARRLAARAALSRDGG